MLTFFGSLFLPNVLARGADLGADLALKSAGSTLDEKERDKQGDSGASSPRKHVGGHDTQRMMLSPRAGQGEPPAEKAGAQIQLKYHFSS